MIIIKKIIVSRNHGKSVNEFTSVLEAQQFILSYAENLPEKKCDPHIVTIIYEDGEKIELFMDCKNPNSDDPDLWIMMHLQNFLMFYAGLWKPENLSDEEYQKYQRENKLGKGWFRDFIEKYETGCKI